MRQGEPFFGGFLLQNADGQRGWQVGSACGVSQLPDWMLVHEHWQNPERHEPPLGQMSMQLPHEML